MNDNLPIWSVKPAQSWEASLNQPPQRAIEWHSHSLRGVLAGSQGLAAVGPLPEWHRLLRSWLRTSARELKKLRGSSWERRSDCSNGWLGAGMVRAFGKGFSYSLENNLTCPGPAMLICRSYEQLVLRSWQVSSRGE